MHKYETIKDDHISIIISNILNLNEHLSMFFYEVKRLLFPTWQAHSRKAKMLCSTEITERGYYECARYIRFITIYRN